MPNENDHVEVENNENDLELDLGTESTEKTQNTEKPKEKKQFTPEEQLAIHKRETKKLEKQLGLNSEEATKSKEKAKPDDSVLLQKLEKMALRSAGIIHQEDIELAQKTAKKWGMDIDEVLLDDDFKVKLERQQTGRTNVEATSGVKGGTGSSQAKNTPEYWLAKGVPPTPADVPDSVTRRKIVRSMLNASKGSGKMKFYNS